MSERRAAWAVKAYRRAYLLVLAVLFAATLVVFVGIGISENRWEYGMVFRVVGWCALGCALMVFMGWLSSMLWGDSGDR